MSMERKNTKAKFKNNPGEIGKALCTRTYGKTGEFTSHVTQSKKRTFIT